MNTRTPKAVYRAAPKRLRAELHERFIDRFEERRAGTGDVDEFAGYHLEQAYRLRMELGESDRRTAQLGEDAGRRLGVAGFGALKRGDMPATESLLNRAVSLLRRGDPARLELMKVLLLEGPSDIGSLASQVPQDRSVVSRHLKVLEQAGIVQVERQGRHRIYALDGAGFVRTLEEILTKAKSLTSICCPPLPAARTTARRP